MWIFQNVASHSKPCLSLWFHMKYQVAMQRWCCNFVGPHKEFHLIWTYLSCESGKLWIASRVPENHYVIQIKMKSALIFMEQMCKIDHEKIAMTTKCKQLSNFKALWCFIHKIIQYSRFLLFFLKCLSHSPGISCPYSTFIFISSSNKSCLCFA